MNNSVLIEMSAYREKTSAEIQDEFSQLCTAVRKQVGDELLALTRRHVLDEEELSEALEGDEPLYDDSEIRRYLGEVGCPICRTGDRIFLGAKSEPETGAGCRIKEASCERMGGEYIGSFHTHPLGGNTPSVPDIECAISREEQIMCIGGNVGGDYKVSCYTPRAKTRRTGLRYNPMMGRYYADESDIPAMGELEFYRESPPPIAEDVLDAIGHNEQEIRYLLARYHGVREDDPDMPEMVIQFLATLAEGEVPEEYYAADRESDGEMDSIGVYSGDAIRTLEKRRRAVLTRDMHICEVKPWP